MNRRDALAALVALPEIARISVARVEPTDVIVVECPGHISMATVNHLTTMLQRAWPGQKVAVLSEGMQIKVVRK